MKLYFETKNGVLYHADCMDIIKHCSEKMFDICLTDPPYGIGNFVQTAGNIRVKAVEWNEHGPSKDFFRIIKKISFNQIIWGANYFNCFDKNGGAIVWVKNQPMPNFSKAEIAACSYHKKVEIYEKTWTNFVNDKKSTHPCERTVSIYDWCLDKYCQEGEMIDPFCGSGSSLIAAEKRGMKWIGIEREEQYCEIAAKRLSEPMQMSLLA